MTNTQTGAYLAVAGLIVSILSHFGIIIPQDAIVGLISEIVVIYGVIHQYFVTKAVVVTARAAGAHI